MKKPHLFVFAAALALLATPVRGADPAPAAAMADDPSAEKVVTVKLKFSAEKPGLVVGIESVTPDPVELSRAKKHFAHWVLSPADSGTLKIAMEDKGGKPFKKQPGTRGKRDHVYSDPVELGEDGSKHKYSVTVRADGQDKDFVLDPLILIRP